MQAVGASKSCRCLRCPSTMTEPRQDRHVRITDSQTRRSPPPRWNAPVGRLAYSLPAPGSQRMIEKSLVPPRREVAHRHRRRSAELLRRHTRRCRRSVPRRRSLAEADAPGRLRICPAPALALLGSRRQEVATGTAGVEPISGGKSSAHRLHGESHRSDERRVMDRPRRN